MRMDLILFPRLSSKKAKSLKIEEAYDVKRSTFFNLPDPSLWRIVSGKEIEKFILSCKSYKSIPGESDLEKHEAHTSQGFPPTL